jgi:Rrf2 family nitric oxide-sensitive transcriptional repressor
MRLATDPRKLKLGDVVRSLEEDVALVECMGENNRCVLTGGCGLEVALGLALENFFRDLNRYSLADLVDTSPALSALALWQPITWPSTPAKSSIPMRRAQK